MLILSVLSVFLVSCKPEVELVRSRIVVAAAADLKFAMDELVEEFQQAHPGTEVAVTYGSSGNFYAQIEQNAPFDLFFSADIDYPRRLAQKGYSLDEVFLYAVGRIVIWAPNASKLNVERLGVAALEDASIQRVAVANPDHAPYGRAAVAALKKLGFYESVASKLVFGENIAQTAQFIQSGAADIGVIALSLAVAPQMKDTGTYWEIPLDAYPKMEQGGIVTRWSRNPEVARAFRAHVLGVHGREVLKRYGFFLPSQN